MDDQRAGKHRIVVRDGETYGYRWADGEITACSLLALREGGPDASFVYLGETVEAAHFYGGTSSEYSEAAGRVDSHLQRLVDAIHSRADAHSEEWVVAVTTDHGHVDEGGHGGAHAIVTRSFLAAAVIGSAGCMPLGETPEEVAPEAVIDLLIASIGE